MINYKNELNGAQYRVVEEGDGPCLVLAGAGSGKTRTITYRVARLIEKGVKPENILLLTFTNKAAAEMLRRVDVLLARAKASKKEKISGSDSEILAQLEKIDDEEKAAGKVQGGTFHSMALNILKQNAKRIGYSERFFVIDSEDAVDMMKLAMEEVGLVGASKSGRGSKAGGNKIPSARLVSGMVSFSVSSGRGLEEIIEERWENWTHVADEIISAAARYADRKKAAAVMDFDDLLLNLRNFLQNNGDAARAISKKFEYILVDEFQDTNKMQSDIVNLLGKEHRNILVVGDDAQSIYSFRAADINNILDFPKLYSGAKIFTLEENYRSTGEILALAGKVIAQNKNQFKKLLKSSKTGDMPALAPFPTQQDEAKFIADKILELNKRGTAQKEIAVLFRAAHHSQMLEMELAGRGIRYDYRGGMKFFERSHIKDVLAFLRAVHNYTDEIAWRRMLVIFEGIGFSTADGIYNIMKGLASSGGWISDSFRDSGGAEKLKELKERLLKALPARAKLGAEKFLRVWEEILKSKKTPENLIGIVMESEYISYLEQKFEDVNSRAADIGQLLNYARISRKDLGRFLAEASLQESYAAERENETRDDKKIVLSTIHQAKGLEWDAVFIINLVHGQFPNERALKEDGGLEEERRLFYVAATRARKHLFLSRPILTAGGFDLAEPSVFLSEAEEHLENLVANPKIARNYFSPIDISSVS